MIFLSDFLGFRIILKIVPCIPTHNFSKNGQIVPCIPVPCIPTGLYNNFTSGSSQMIYQSKKLSIKKLR